MRITLAIAVICLAMTACGGSSADPDVSGEAFDGLSPSATWDPAHNGRCDTPWRRATWVDPS